MKPKYVTYSIFDSAADCLVNPVNLVGVMGGGLASEFKKRYPDMFKDYRIWCSMNPQDGALHLWGPPDEPVSIINIPTKHSWRDPSELSLIKKGLINLRMVAHRLIRIHSIAIPKLGCGLGGLDWDDVKPVIENAVADSAQRIYIHV